MLEEAKIVAGRVVKAVDRHGYSVSAAAPAICNCAGLLETHVVRLADEVLLARVRRYGRSMIRPRVAALAVVVACALTVVATASAGPPRIVRTYAGITCTWPKITDGVLCHRANGTGYAFGISRHVVLVRNSRGRTVLIRNQPTRSPGFDPLDDPLIFHRETHRGMNCYWSTLNGGGAGCMGTDLHGYTAFVGNDVIRVLNEASKTVFLRNQP